MMHRSGRISKDTRRVPLILSMLLGSMLIITVVDIYIPEDLVYVSCVWSYSSVGRNWIFSFEGCNCMYFSGLGRGNLRCTAFPLALVKYEDRSVLAKLSVSKEFLAVDLKDWYYKAYLITREGLKFHFAKKGDVFSVIRELPSGLYFIEKYAVFPVGVRECGVVYEPKLVAYIVLEKSNRSSIFTMFDYPLDHRIPKHILEFRANVIPPWYALLRIIAIILYPVCATILLGYLILKRRSMRVLMLLVAATIIYAYKVSSLDISYYCLYAKTYAPEPFSVLIPGPFREFYVERVGFIRPSKLIFKLNYSENVSVRGFLLNLEIPYNTTVPLIDLINRTAFRHLIILAKIMKVDKIAVQVSSKWLKVICIGGHIERIGDCYIFSIGDIDKVFVQAEPPVIYLRSLTGGLVAMRPPCMDGERFSGYIHVGIPVKVSILVIGED